MKKPKSYFYNLGFFVVKNGSFTKKEAFSNASSLSVTNLGFEPRTPSLKGMCSTG